mgnify:CR=1 FL=1
MLDVLKQPFIQTARSKGLSENAVNWKHAARIAINPIISRIGVYLPEIIASCTSGPGTVNWPVKYKFFTLLLINLGLKKAVWNNVFAKP